MPCNHPPGSPVDACLDCGLEVMSAEVEDAFETAVTKMTSEELEAAGAEVAELAPVIPLRARPAPPTDDGLATAVEILEYALDLAKAGELTGLLLAMDLGNGELHTAYTPAIDTPRRIGLLEIVKADWLRSLSEEV